jgi:hypothetical protein
VVHAGTDDKSRRQAGECDEPEGAKQTNNGEQVHARGGCMKFLLSIHNRQYGTGHERSEVRRDPANITSRAIHTNDVTFFASSKNKTLAPDVTAEPSVLRSRCNNTTGGDAVSRLASSDTPFVMNHSLVSLVNNSCSIRCKSLLYDDGKPVNMTQAASGTCNINGIVYAGECKIRIADNKVWVNDVLRHTFQVGPAAPAAAAAKSVAPLHEINVWLRVNRRRFTKG